MGSSSKNLSRFVEIIKEESSLLDTIISQQDAVHEFVIKRSWLELDSALKNLGKNVERFSELDSIREDLSSKNDFTSHFELSPLISSLKSKLLKSKIQNKVLNEYVSTTKGFLQKVFDEALPERYGVTYSRCGKIVKGTMQNVVVNQIV